MNAYIDLRRSQTDARLLMNHILSYVIDLTFEMNCVSMVKIYLVRIYNVYTQTSRVTRSQLRMLIVKDFI